ncbi:hypothetical protein [Trinickia mobilis]|uniref:hypothetical protein n=1 Tax=Trinickia mobilis TaxID=2816356 RepID=UPI001A8C9BBA|nr:hypothetical protein [Trinickia mobilis]
MNTRKGQRRGRESALFGVMRRFGQILPFADKVIASFRTESAEAERIAGVLFTHDARIPTVFERQHIGELSSLPGVGEQALVKVTCRPWLDGNGQLSFIVRDYQVLTDQDDSAQRHASIADQHELGRCIS